MTAVAMPLEMMGKSLGKCRWIDPFDGDRLWKRDDRAGFRPALLPAARRFRPGNGGVRECVGITACSGNEQEGSPEQESAQAETPDTVCFSNVSPSAVLYPPHRPSRLPEET